MKKQLFKNYLRISALICAALISCQKTAEDSGKTAKESIIAVTENAYPPLNFASEDGKGMGFEYDLTNEIASKIGRKVQWSLAGWDVMIQSVRQGMYDVGMDGIAVTDERKEQIDFSIPYLTIRQIMLVRSDESRFRTAAEFAAIPEAKIAVQTGTTNFYVAVNLLQTTPENPGQRIVLLENFGAAVQALISGDVDMVILDDVSARRYTENEERLKTLDDVLSEEQIAYIFPKNSLLVEEFNEGILALQQDGTIDRLQEKWFVRYGNSSN